MDFTPVSPGRVGFKMIFAVVIGTAGVFAMVYAQPESRTHLPSPETFTEYPDYRPAMGGPGFRPYGGPDAYSYPHHVRMVPRQSLAVKPS